MSDNYSQNLIGQVLDERYALLEIIGEGGMAVVYRGHDNRLDRDVAIKLMRSEFLDDELTRERFKAESRAVAMLSHNNIVSVFDVSHTDDIEYIVMELIQGITLRQYMDKKGALPWKEALHFSKQIADGINHAHTHGIIHRDIKPQNVMLLKDGTIKVADFGIAALENEVNDYDNQAIGSLSYLSPEQLKGQSPDARSDIYSIGVLMYELLCGAKPYIASNPAELNIMQINGVYKPISEYSPDVPEKFSSIVSKAMETDINKRYQSASELYEDLAGLTELISNNTAKASDADEPLIKSNPLKLEVKPTVKISRKALFKTNLKANRIGFGLGTFALMASVLALFAFLWNFWLKELFSEADRVSLPNFVDYNYSVIANNVDLNSIYNFKIVYINDTTKEVGLITDQDPKAGRSLMLTDDGIDVTLTVNQGSTLTEVPYVVGKDYREASLLLTNAGFEVEIDNTTSDIVDKNKVISSSPESGTKISTGSTVYISVSSGTDLEYVKMPNVIGLSEEAARIKIENAGLTFNGSTRQSSDYEAGTVISQSVVAFAELEELSKVTVIVSTGPDPNAVEEEYVLPTVNPTITTVTASPTPEIVYNYSGQSEIIIG